MSRQSTLPVLVAAALASACAGGSADGRRAEAMLDRGDFAGARRTAEHGLERAPRDPLLWQVRMRALLGGGDARGAVALYASWRDLRRDDDPAALRALARATLWQALRAHAPAIQAAAVQAIERLELDDLAPQVAELVGSEDDLVAAAAASALLTAHEDAPRVLVDLLRSGDPAARALAVDGIGRKAGAHARADLVPMLGDPDANVRRAAAAAVARFAEGDDLARLIELARRDPSGPVRAQVVRGLAGREIAGRVDLARQAAADPFLGARQAAVDLLARTDEPAAAALLAELAASSDLPVALAAEAARLRAGAPPDQRTAVFERALADRAWTARAAALNAAYAAPRPLALALAGRALVDRRAEVRLAAARLLLHMGQTERASQELVAALASPDAMIRLDAAVDLYRLGDQRGLAVLERLARSRSIEVRTAAVQAHASLPRVTPGLVAALADPTPELRLAAAERLLEVLD